MQLLGLGAVAITGQAQGGARPSRSTAVHFGSANPSIGRPFKPLLGPIPLGNDGLNAAAQRSVYSRASLRDDLIVPEGYRSEVLLQWGDPLGSSHFGFNNDYLAFIPLEDGRALLTVNFEYISPRPWCGGYREVMGRDLPFTQLKELLSARGGRVDALALAADDPLRQPLLEVATAALEDLGIGVAEIAALLEGQLDRKSAAAAGALATRQYAKRQYTWFANQSPSGWHRSVTQLDVETISYLATILRDKALTA